MFLQHRGLGRAEMLTACSTGPVQSIGPMQRSDVPTAAVDFHVSSIIPALLQDSAVMQAAASCVSAGEASDPESALQKAMWRHRSSINHKQVRQLLSHADCIISSDQSLPWGGCAELAFAALPMKGAVKRHGIAKRVIFDCNIQYVEIRSLDSGMVI